MNKKSEYGPCCICESDSPDVVNFITLDYKVESESCWGCVVCDLPSEGAVAIVCHVCIEKHAEDIESHIRFLVDTAERRIPVPPVADRVSHRHDLSKHPELWGL